MAIVPATDIIFRLSVTTGSAGNSTAGTPAASLGKYMSTTATMLAENDLFDAVSGSENASSMVDYRCFFIFNNHATLSWDNVTVYVSSQVSGGTSLAIATDNIGPVAFNSSSAQAALIASDTTAPTGVSAFSTPTTDGAGLSIGSIPAQQVKAVWVKRTAANTSAVADDGGVISVSGDTAA